MSTYSFGANSGDKSATASPAPQSMTLAQKSAVDTDVATLVSDGASPTQGHVNALNGHWTTAKATFGTAPADVVLQVSSTLSRNEAARLIKLLSDQILGQL